jgi:dipeptidyl aminopeptidase/acylaminoacyl peptidase
VSWLLVVVGVLVAYQLVVLVALIVFWRNPRVPSRRTPADLGLEFSEVRIPTARRKSLYGWWVPAEGDGPRPVVVLVHGWGRNAERMLPYLPILHPLGMHLLAFDSRHHGLSDEDGYSSMLKVSEDVRAAVSFALAQPGVDAGRVGVLGLSIGGAATIHAAAHDHRVRAATTAGAFADPREAMVMPGRLGLLVRPALPLAFRYIEWRIGARFSEIAPEAVIARARARFLIVHGDADVVVPVGQAHRLAAAAGDRAELWVMPGRGHSDTHLEPGYPERLTSFLLRELGWRR